MGLLSELKLTVPWGHIAAKAWGSLRGPPVLCLHGWLDNANSFDRLIPLLPQDFYYVAMDFGGHGLSSHYGPGAPYYHQNFVNEVRRVVAALKWSRFSLMGHSFGGFVGSMFSCIFPEMVDKLILLDGTPFAMDTDEMENLLTYKRRAIEHVLQVEASQKPPRVVSPEEMLQGFLKNNSHVGEECGKLLLQRGTTQGATGSGAGKSKSTVQASARHLARAFLLQRASHAGASESAPINPFMRVTSQRSPPDTTDSRSTALTSSAGRCSRTPSSSCRPASCLSKQHKDTVM
uniref:Serine hydrolase like 2 n=1 Tax=Urocitellus parryii TaxID=9999 RepID=A0A8D2KCF2_UROPR